MKIISLVEKATDFFSSQALTFPKYFLKIISLVEKATDFFSSHTNVFQIFYENYFAG